MTERDRVDARKAIAWPDPVALPEPHHARWLVVICLTFLFVAEGLAIHLDLPAARLASALPRDQVRIWNLITEFGTSGYMFAVSATIAGTAWVMQRWVESPILQANHRTLAARATFFFACIATSGILAQMVKHLAGRMRPRYLGVDGAFVFLGPSWHHGADSFPSGHTTSAFAAATALGLMLPGWRLILAGAAILIGLSRIATGNHYPSDVVSGMALGTSVTLGLALWLARRNRVFSRRPSS